LIYDSDLFFDSVSIFEKNTEVGGVWASNRIYDGLTTNSPVLTYEIPGFPYPEELRKCGKHVKAQEVNSYLRNYAEQYELIQRTRFGTHVEEISWEPQTSGWLVRGKVSEQKFCDHFSHIVVCTGLYHAGHMPFSNNQTSQFSGNMWHSSKVANSKVQEILATSKDVVVIGAGKSAIDLATLLAQGRLSEQAHDDPPAVSLVYRRPHWLSPRKIVRNIIPFEKLLFSRFVVSSHP
jgi:dimethylaniline monooxygenase (N-oxide forming)